MWSHTPHSAISYILSSLLLPPPLPDSTSILPQGTDSPMSLYCTPFPCGPGTSHRSLPPHTPRDQPTLRGLIEYFPNEDSFLAYMADKKIIKSWNMKRYFVSSSTEKNSCGKAQSGKDSGRVSEGFSMLLPLADSANVPHLDFMRHPMLLLE